ncbi:MAG: linear amide C-N hydrolase [Muribaculaceae bacterium]|nr:linear amide C-N hydrolase [Muribaculaceae bacterium]
MKTLKLIAAALLAVTSWTAAEACSRVVYAGDKGYVLVGRTLDWRTPIPTNIYVYPRGVAKMSMPDGPNLTWTSKYGSVLAVSYDGGVTEGMNEKGLVMNGLFCKTAIYEEASLTDGNKPIMSLSMLVSYFLDNFASVDEVATWLDGNRYAISGKTFDGGTVSALHWAITDTTGDTLIMEYNDGQLKTYRGKDLKVLTNDPAHPQMSAINNYWTAVGGVNMLPGSVRSADRYVRASFFINHVPTDFDYAQALGSLESIMGTVSVPYGYELPGEPNVSSTQWRSVADATGGKYYFKFADETGDFWIDLRQIDLREGASILKFDTVKKHNITGLANQYLEKTAGFTPMY